MAVAVAAVLLALAGPVAVGASAAPARPAVDYFTVSGTAEDSFGAPLAGWSVWFAPNFQVDQAVSTTFDSLGHYSVSLPAGGFWAVAIFAPGSSYSSETEGVENVAGLVEIQSAMTMDFDLPLVARTLTVVDDHGAPVAGATVASQAQTGVTLSQSVVPGANGGGIGDRPGQQAVTDANGQATLDLLSARDPDAVTVTPPLGSPLQPVTATFSDLSSSGSQTVHLYPPEPTEPVSGVARTSKGAPLQHWNVAFMPTGQPEDATIVTTANDGSYTASVPIIDTSVEVFDGTSLAVPTDYVRGDGLSVSAPMTLDLTEPVAALSVHVEDSQGQPVSGTDLLGGLEGTPAPLPTGHLFPGSTGDVGWQFAVETLTDDAGQGELDFLETGADTAVVSSYVPSNYQDPADLVITPSADQSVTITLEPVPTVLPGVGEVVPPTSGTTVVDVPVTLSAAPIKDPVQVAWQTIWSSSAPAGEAPQSDFTAATGMVTFAPGQSIATVPITVKGNSSGNHREYIPVYFHVISGNATMTAGLGLGFGVIDPVEPLVVPGAGSVVAPGSGTSELDVPVSLSAPSASTVTVHWHTLVVSGLAGEAPTSDYTAASGTVTFAPGQTSATVPITVSGDSSGQEELIVVSFTSPTNAVLGGYLGLGFGTIEPGP
jgi:hypothetical protein